MNNLENLISKIKSNNFTLLNSKDMKSFKISDLFEISKPKGYKTTDITKGGNTPYIARSSFNNGITNYVQDNPENIGGCITVHSEWKENFAAFYQDKSFITDGHIYVLRPKIDKINWKISKYNAIFICILITYSYPDYRVKNQVDRIGQTSIDLFIDKEGNIDWKYIEDLTKSRMNILKSKLK